MQNKYVGDFGDFVKLSILRALMPGHVLGVGWWLFPDETESNDGRHIDYLHHPARWRAFDAPLFDNFSKIAFSESRSIHDLEANLPNAVFFDELIPVEGATLVRRSKRIEWSERLERALSDCNLVFADPDNGLEPATYSSGSKTAGKSISLVEAKALLTPGRTLLIYHHQTRRKGGHADEIAHWITRFKEVGVNSVQAIRSGRYSPRVFFLLNATPELRQRAEFLVKDWHGHLTWHF